MMKKTKKTISLVLPRFYGPAPLLLFSRRRPVRLRRNLMRRKMVLKGLKG